MDFREALQAGKIGIGGASDHWSRLFAQKVLGGYVQGYAEGAIASFNNGVNAPVDKLLVEILPVQPGTGDPSPENIRPISGWTGANVTRCGKNLCNPDEIVHAPIRTTQNGGGIGNENEAYRTVIVDYLPKGTYTFSLDMENPYIIRAQVGGTKHDVGDGYIIENFTHNASRLTVTTTQSGLFMIAFRNTNTSVITVEPNCLLEAGSEATAYTPYTGTTYPITWQTEAGTVYGGELDVTSGVLTVDRVIYTFTGDNNWIKSFDDRNLFYRNRPSDLDALGSEFLCNIFTKSPTTSGIQNEQYAIGNNYITVRHDSTTTLVDFRSFLNNTNLTICAPLATTLTYHLTPTEVTTLLGVNNVWADTGDVKVWYKKKM